MSLDIDKNEESFAELFEKSYTGAKRYEPGEVVETEIVSISGDFIFLQLGGKSEGVIEAGEFVDKDGDLTVAVGDTVKVFFLEARNGEMYFTTKVRGEKAGNAVLQNAFENSIPVEGNVAKEIKGGFEIRIGESRAFCPFSQMDNKRVENAADYVGKNLTFKITEYGEKGRNILVSNRAILEEVHNNKIEELKDKLTEGTVVTGTVVSIRDFGAFVDLDGIQALLPISEISRDRVNKVEDYVTVGQEIEAKILSTDWNRERISVSMKALIADPWDAAAETYRAGTKHIGKVVRVTHFGAFVNLEVGIDGLVHVSDLGLGRDDNPKSFVKVGEEMTVLVNSFDRSRQRISLKPFSEVDQQEAEAFEKYSEPDGETYNPFADLLKGKK